MKLWRYVQACSRGTSHFISNLPCQDRALSKVIIDSDGQEIFLGAVSDGAGSACRSEYGAEIATRLILKKLEDFFKEGGSLTDQSKSVIEQWINQISDQIGELANDEGVSRREYACTLLAVAVKPMGGVFFQIGDGAIVVGEGGEYYPVFWPMTGEYANSTYFITDVSAVKQMKFEIINDRLMEDIALMSDGLQGLALQFSTKTAYAPFFKPMFTRLAEENSSGLSALLSASLQKFLDSELVCNRTDDDKTLILSTCRCEVFSPAVLEEELDSNEAL
ncbi:MAG: PP2C family serine/threonine-protein phosphatase [Leptolyngbyaceae cyanobacterium]